MLTVYSLRSGEPSKLNPVPAQSPLAPFLTVITVAFSAKLVIDITSDTPGSFNERLASRISCTGAWAKTKPVSGAVKKMTTALDCTSSETTSKYHQSQDVEFMSIIFGASR